MLSQKWTAFLRGNINIFIITDTFFASQLSVNIETTLTHLVDGASGKIFCTPKGDDCTASCVAQSQATIEKLVYAPFNPHVIPPFHPAFSIAHYLGVFFRSLVPHYLGVFFRSLV